jgi:hypothetical protein
LQPLGLTAPERHDLEAFLRALSPERLSGSLESAG